MKNKPKRKKKKGSAGGFPPATETPVNTPDQQTGGKSRWGLIVLFIVIALGGVYLQRFLRDLPYAGMANVPNYTYEVIKKHPHDTDSFTQGLVLEGNHVWESTGKWGASKVRQVELETGKVKQEFELEEDYFGEGLAVRDDLIYQLTWRSNKCFVYDRDLKKVKEFTYSGEGWGLTYDGKEFIMSDGTFQLQFRDPETFESTRVISVHNGTKLVTMLNELEYSGGKIYANALNEDVIYEINPEDGQIEGVIDLSGLWPTKDRPSEGLLNGIAVDAEAQRIILTGKYCPHIYEVKFIRK